MVHGGFSSDTTIHLGEQGGRYLNERDSALVRGGNETGEIADHSTAQGNQGRLSVAMQLQQAVVDGPRPLKRFGRFSFGNLNELGDMASGGQARFDFFAEQAPN